MSKRTLIGCAAVLVLLLNIFVSNASGNVPPRFDIQDDNRSLIDLADGVVTASGSSSGDHYQDDEAYQKAVETFARHYSDTIDHTNPLVHKMLMHSEGADTMTKVDIEELGDLLSDMGAAPHSEVVGSYPEGYEDCDRYLRAGTTSLGLAAAAVRGFNESADMEYLRDYRRLIAMYMRAVADAQWCVSDHTCSISFGTHPRQPIIVSVGLLHLARVLPLVSPRRSTRSQPGSSIPALS